VKKVFNLSVAQKGFHPKSKVSELGNAGYYFIELLRSRLEGCEVSAYSLFFFGVISGLSESMLFSRPLLQMF
jgi:hypothetical protein